MKEMNPLKRTQTTREGEIKQISNLVHMENQKLPLTKHLQISLKTWTKKW